MKLRPATPADIAAIRTIAQLPQHALLITDEDDAALLDYVQNPHSRLFMVETGTDPAAGFALFCELDSRAGAVELRRLALREVGAGRGRAFVQMLTDYAFETFGARRVWLDTAHDNIRAQKVYKAVGYTLEGCLRQHGWIAPLGQPCDEWIYGLLRGEWQALREGRAKPTFAEMTGAAHDH
jgi:RimJ/RimL family protein N-acetyltransferase